MRDCPLKEVCNCILRGVGLDEILTRDFTGKLDDISVVAAQCKRRKV
jgi:hypothetical protein